MLFNSLLFHKIGEFGINLTQIGVRLECASVCSVSTLSRREGILTFFFVFLFFFAKVTVGCILTFTIFEAKAAFLYLLVLYTKKTSCFSL